MIQYAYQCDVTIDLSSRYKSNLKRRTFLFCFRISMFGKHTLSNEMYIVLLFRVQFKLIIFKNYYFILDLNCFTKTYEIGQNIIFSTPNFTLIDSLLSTNRSKSSVREHTTWLIRQIPLNQYREIARYDLIENRFILNHHEDSSYTIDENTGQLTLINTTDENVLHTEITLHAETGLSKGDEILHDVYRLVRLSNSSSKQIL